MNIKLVTDAAGLETLIKNVFDQKNKVISLYDDQQTFELGLDLKKAISTIAMKDRDPKATQAVMESKLAMEFEAEDKQLLAKKKAYKEAEAELECLDNQLSASKKLMEVKSGQVK